MKKHDQGSLLILALWSLLLLSAFSVSLGYSVRQKAALLERLESLDALYPIAFSGVEAARGLMKSQDAAPSSDSLNDDWSKKKSLFCERSIGEKGYFSVSYLLSSGTMNEPEKGYGLIDEQRKININTSDAATLARLLQFSGGLDKDTAEEAAYCIIDWRDTDSTFQHPNYGAEDDYYNHLNTPYAAKNAPFEVIDELLLVRGINRSIFDKIKECLTPYGVGEVNINTASKEVLLALGLEERLVDTILDYRNGIDKEARTADDRTFLQNSTIITDLGNVITIDQAEIAALENLISNGKLGTSSTHFMVKSRGILRKNGAFLDMESVIDRKGRVYCLRASRVQWPSRT